jgi:hypothetical protein
LILTLDNTILSGGFDHPAYGVSGMDEHQTISHWISGLKQGPEETRSVSEES